MKKEVNSEKLSMQRAFWSQLGGQQPFTELFNHLQGVYLFIKDVNGRFVGGSQGFVEHLGFSREEEIIGANDYDVFPPQLADNYLRDDATVMNTGNPLIGHVEVFYNEHGILDWFVTNKLPIYDRNGNIAGIMGTLQSYDDKQNLLMPFFELTKVVDHIRIHYKEPITVEQLAKLAHLSTRQLRRKFHQIFNMSTQEFLLKTRIQAASNALLNTSDSILKTALQFGFCDQSTFTQQFRKYVGMTPLKYRNKYGGLKDHLSD